MDARGALGSPEYGNIWARFERVFNVRPTVRPAGFAGIDALPRVGIQKRMLTGTDIADLESAVLAAFQSALRRRDGLSPTGVDAWTR